MLQAGAKAAVLAGVREGRYRLLYVSPERIAGEGSDGFLAKIAGAGVSFVAIDEAHCISQWGHDFRPEYRQLARLRSVFPNVSLHAFTATATARVRRDIASQLELRSPLELVGSFDRPNLVYRVLPRASLKRQIQDVLARRSGQAGIIYCSSRREVDALAAWLSEIGVRTRPYHAGLPDHERSRNQAPIPVSARITRWDHVDTFPSRQHQRNFVRVGTDATRASTLDPNEIRPGRTARRQRGTGSELSDDHVFESRRGASGDSVARRRRTGRGRLPREGDLTTRFADRKAGGR